jgi:hypothetical protein
METSASDDGRHRISVSHFAYLSVLAIGHLPPFAM